MNCIDLIEIKKKNQHLNEDQIKFFIKKIMDKSIPDYQISALLMAIWFNGLDANELYYLTKAMINSGKIISFHPEYKKILIDKHSTGGIGDKVSIALAPILSCFDVGVAKLSGRGLGFTGGTIDKLESINVKTTFSLKDAKKILNRHDMFILSQSEDLVPADKILYAIRDVTATVDSLPLIAASILSKKLALKTDYIFIDIKYGVGSFCSDKATGEKLGKIITKLANQFKRKVFYKLSDMNHVLGRTIGNAIEVQEAINYLKNDSNVGQDFKELMLDLISFILMKTKIYSSKKIIEKKLNEILTTQKAFYKLCDWVESQNGNKEIIMNNIFFKPKYELDIKSNKAGKVIYPNIIGLAELGIDLGAGRRIKDDKIDFQAGIYLNKKDGEKVKNGETVFKLFSSKPISNKINKNAYELFKIQ